MDIKITMNKTVETLDSCVRHCKRQNPKHRVYFQITTRLPNPCVLDNLLAISNPVIGEIGEIKHNIAFVRLLFPLVQCRELSPVTSSMQPDGLR